MLWGKRNCNQTIETQTSRIRIVDLIAANVDTESEKLLYLTIIPPGRVGYEMIDSQRGA